MGKMIAEEINRLSEKNDDELMQLFIKQTMSSFPSTVVVRALENVFEKRNIVPTGMVVGFKFLTNGNEQIINADFEL